MGSTQTLRPYQVRTLIEAAIEAEKTTPALAGHLKPTYPKDHVAGMKVPKGGSSCASCEYLAGDGKECSSEHFQKWNGSNKLPAPADEYCSDWWEPKKDIEAGGPGSGRHKGDGYRGFGGKHYQEYGFLDPFKKKVLQGSSNGDHDLLARTRLQIKSKKGNESGVAVQNGYVRYIITPDHTAVFQHVGNESGDRAIMSFLLGKNEVKDVILHVGNDESTSRIQQFSKTELMNRYEDKGIHGAAEDSDSKGTLWNGIQITGFSTPEEEALRAMLSRVPPELLFNVKKIESAKELGAKHGRFISETQTIQFNPENLRLRQRFGKGPGWILHQELTVVHEVGHSIYDTFSPESKQAWEAISGWMKGWKPGQLPAYVEQRPGWGHEVSKWTHKPGILFTRHYGERNPGEDFADCFGFFLLGKGHQMAPAKRKFLEQLIQDRVRKYPAAGIQSPIRPYVLK